MPPPVAKEANRMSGHSKWSTIKHQKGAADVRRGALFTKLSRDITLAVRQGSSGDPDTNFRLRLAIDKAKAGNMPLDIVTRAIKRGSGEGGEPGEQLEEVIYEGYGPGGGAILLQAATTNRKRTASEVRAAFNKAGGSLGESGCVAWNFETRGVLTLEIADQQRGEEVALKAIDAGADDVQVEDGIVEIYTAPDRLQQLQAALAGEGVALASAAISLVPKTTVPLNAKQAEQALRLLDNLEDLADVQKAYTNVTFPPEALEKYRSSS